MNNLSAHSDTDDFRVVLSANEMKKHSARGSLLFGIAQIIRMLIQIGSQIILARLLFPAEFGIIAMVYPLVDFAAIFSIGFGEAIVQRNQLSQAQLSALFWINISITIILAIILMSIAPIVAAIYREPRVIPLMLLVSIFLPLGSLSGIQTALLTRFMRFGVIVRNELVAAVIGTIVTVLCACYGWSYWSLAFGNLAMTSIGAGLGWISSEWRPTRPSFSNQVWADVKFGSNITGFNLATFLTTSGDNIIVGVMTGEHSLGLYDRSYRLVVQPLGQVIAPISRVLIPLLSRLADDDIEYGKVFLVAMRAVVTLTVPGMLVCVVYGHEIVGLLLGPRWTEAGEILSWISVSGLTTALQIAIFWLFVSQARMKGLRRMTIITAVFSVASFFVGSFWGIRGVAISVGLTSCLITTPLIVLGGTRTGPVSLARVTRACLPLCVAGLMTVTVILFARDIIMAGDLVRVLLALSISYSIFIGTMLISRSDRIALRTFMSEFKRRPR